jgi:rare lipoprotein A
MAWTSQTDPRNRLVWVGFWLPCIATLLAGCQDLGGLSTHSSAVAHPGKQGVQIVERDIETPEAFETAEAALWDGQPTLGGVWVAHPAVQDPIRVILRNPATQTFIIGNLFRNDPAPGEPPIRVSADAARALDMSAGQATQLHVTALKREAVSTASKTTPMQHNSTDTGISVLLQTDISKTQSAGLKQAYLQIGLFRIEANAVNSAGILRTAGAPAVVKQSRHKGKTFWRVLAGPCQTVEARNILRGLVRSKGFTDAYAVAN